MRAHRIINLYYYNEVNKDTKYEWCTHFIPNFPKDF